MLISIARAATTLKGLVHQELGEGMTEAAALTEWVLRQLKGIEKQLVLHALNRRDEGGPSDDPGSYWEPARAAEEKF